MKKLILSVLAVLVSHVAFAAASIDLGVSSSTPYDRYMSPVKAVLTHLNGTTSPTMDQVRHWMNEGRNFRYTFTDPYTAVTPEQTEATRSGDCKAKSLWLASQINDPNVRFVIGRARSNSKMSHAWLMWKSPEGRWYILDCTNMREPIPADRINPEKEYIPQYSYTRSGSFRHMSTEIAAATSGKAAMVASN